METIFRNREGDEGLKTPRDCRCCVCYAGDLMLCLNPKSGQILAVYWKNRHIKGGLYHIPFHHNCKLTDFIMR